LPNLWFTLAVPAPEFERGVTELRETVAPYALLRLPALRRFKIDVVFDATERALGETVPGAPLAEQPVPQTEDIVWTERERTLVRALQGTVGVCANFYERLAKDLGWPPDELLGALGRWKRCGALRRIALIVRHRRLGFTANAMCVWRVDAARIVEAGRRVAAWPQVTHCYQRAVLPGWSYNLFAMIHAGDWLSLRRLGDQIAESAGLGDGRMLGSLHEFKKTSMRYFEA
jgi:DNA-binding Lrp family transcriptional regulator